MQKSKMLKIGLCENISDLLKYINNCIEFEFFASNYKCLVNCIHNQSQMELELDNDNADNIN